ncbi:MAG: hypothetical protein UT29_C0001G0160 [Candidatus Yanofskybacteria bacterium GW2011_GWA1_39_13]|uniref:Uncharacterized protein n=1 Tax=Yanofskybacteria sp. (strain GW2011_GWA1_39_13) TaxID=1619019 RepID=A0A0G0PX08_YANXG|nr:MAG: hypothetical protein UT29_C0001G0160 [Candidatus Yanofskybacteria bacterium GW2011_GWA1_39_13]
MYYNTDMDILNIKYITKGLTVAIGIIIIWRGVWILLDLLDDFIFGGNHIVSAIGGIIVGILMLYLPDKNLKALERL